MCQEFAGCPETQEEDDRNDEHSLEGLLAAECSQEPFQVFWQPFFKFEIGFSVLAVFPACRHFGDGEFLFACFNDQFDSEFEAAIAFDRNLLQHGFPVQLEAVGRIMGWQGC